MPGGAATCGLRTVPEDF